MNQYLLIPIKISEWFFNPASVFAVVIIIIHFNRHLLSACDELYWFIFPVKCHSSLNVTCLLGVNSLFISLYLFISSLWHRHLTCTSVFVCLSVLHVISELEASGFFQDAVSESIIVLVQESLMSSGIFWCFVRKVWARCVWCDCVL